MNVVRFVVSPSSNEESETPASQEEELTPEKQPEEVATTPLQSPPSTGTTPTKEETATTPSEQQPLVRSRAGSKTGSDSFLRPKQRLQHDWLISEDTTSHHLTIGPHGGVDWVRRLALDKTRKTSEPGVSGSGAGQGGLSSCRSTDCLPKDSSSSDSDLLRSAPPWTRSKFRFSPEKEKTEQEPETKPTTPVAAPPAVTPTSATATGATPKVLDPAELAAKKQRVKQSLIKRARSVAIFSLKLKERRAREAKAIEQPPPKPVKEVKPLPKEVVGGELGFVPLEMLIQVDDVAKDMQRRQMNNT